MSAGYRVKVRGTWSRANTHGNDITMVRELVARTNVNPGAMYTLANLEDVKFVVSKRDDREDPLFRTGRLEATVTFKTGGYIRSTVAFSRAKTLLKWAMQDSFCRSPKVADLELVSSQRVYDL